MSRDRWTSFALRLPRTALVALPVVFSAACTCSEPPTLEGRVVDPWEHHVDGVKVTMPGVAEPSVTDENGRFTFPLRTGAYTLKAEREGYISGQQGVNVVDPDTTAITRIQVIPEPTSAGYHIVGPESYLTLTAVTVERVGNELKQFQGIRSAGDVEIDGKNVRVVFHTPLRMDQVARLDIELHRLTFTRTMEVATVDGKVAVDVNLWTDSGAVDFEREELGSDDNYVFKVDNLPSGTYAFVSLNLLDPDNAKFGEIAESVRSVHPFTVR